MTDPCADHRPYLAALADGEVDLVPAATYDHVETCAQCRAELQTHRLLGQKLKTAALRDGTAWRRAFLPLAAAAAVVLVAVGSHLATSSGPDPLAAAVAVAGRQPVYFSSNAGDLATWCRNSYGNRVPAVAVPGLQPVGARMDWPNGIPVATVSYTADGRALHISWVGRDVGGSAPSEVTVDGRPAVVVRLHGISAVVTGAAPESELVTVAREVAASE